MSHVDCKDCQQAIDFSDRHDAEVDQQDLTTELRW